MSQANKTDVDIDIADRDKLLQVIKHVNASIINENTIRKHNVGIYVQDIPEFLGEGMASIDYREAGQYGFYKIDILNNSVYENIRNEAHLDFLMTQDTDWSILVNDTIIPDLFQIHNYGNYLKLWKPSSLEELAMFIAMIRPAKKHLLDSKLSWDEIRKQIWVRPTNADHFFKKSHSIAYAGVIRLQLNFISYG